MARFLIFPSFYTTYWTSTFGHGRITVYLYSSSKEEWVDETTAYEGLFLGSENSNWSPRVWN